MEKINLSLTILSLLISGCNPNSENQTNSKTNNCHLLQIDPSQSKSLQLSSFIDSMAFIPLETKEKKIIANAKKIQVYRDKFYIFDQDGNSIFIFDHNGAYLSMLRRIGRGPGEYLQLVDFQTNKHGLFLLDYPNTVIHYNHELEFLRTFNLKNTYTFSFTNFKNSFWISNEKGSENDKYHFSVIDKDGVNKRNLIKKEFIDKKYNWRISSDFYNYGNILYFSPALENQIYKTDGNEVKIAYNINFGKFNVPENTNIFNNNVYSPAFQYATRQHFWIDENSLIFDFLFKGKRQFGFYNKKTDKLQYGAVSNDIHKNYRFLPSWKSGKILIEIIDVLTMNEYFTDLKTSIDCLKELSLEDNPILVIYYLK